MGKKKLKTIVQNNTERKQNVLNILWTLHRLEMGLKIIDNFPWNQKKIATICGV